MRGIFTWLLVFGVLAGLNSRVLSANGSRVQVCHVIDACCADDHHHHDDGAPASHEDEESPDHDSPQDHHHHHGSCFQVVHLAIDKDVKWSIASVYSSLVAIRPAGESTPEGPFASLDKPPLI